MPAVQSSELALPSRAAHEVVSLCLHTRDTNGRRHSNWRAFIPVMHQRAAELRRHFVARRWLPF